MSNRFLTYQFHDSSGERLPQWYEDYKSKPAYDNAILRLESASSITNTMHIDHQGKTTYFPKRFGYYG